MFSWTAASYSVSQSLNALTKREACFAFVYCSTIGATIKIATMACRHVIVIKNIRIGKQIA